MTTPVCPHCSGALYQRVGSTLRAVCINDVCPSKLGRTLQMVEIDDVRAAAHCSPYCSWTCVPVDFNQLEWRHNGHIFRTGLDATLEDVMFIGNTPTPFDVVHAAPESSYLGPSYFLHKENVKGSSKFHAVLKELGELHDKKQADYGLPGDPFSNVRASQEWGIAPWIGALIRLNDKVNRLKKVAKGGTLSNEGVVDSLNDIAVYAMIARCLYEEMLEEQERSPKI